MRPRSSSSHLHRAGQWALVLALATPAFLASQDATSAAASDADEKPDDLLTIEHFLDMENVGSPQLSPDGSQVIYTRSHVNRLEDRWDSELWIMNTDASRNRFLTKGSSPRWSPDGTRIAYMAPGDPKGAQLHVRWMDAEGATSQITRVTESPSSFRWSPDGNSIAFLMLVPDAESWPLEGMPSPPAGANWTKTPRMVTKTHFRQDRQGFMEEGFTHLFVVPADGGTPRQLTQGDWNVGARFSGLRLGAGVSWTPDGSEIVFDGLMDEAPELDGYGQNYIYAVDVETGDIRQVVTEKGNWTGPVVSPDGRTVAFTGYPFTLQSYKSSELFTAPLAGGAPTRISGDLDRDVGSIFWADGGGGIYFTAGNQGQQNIHHATADGSSVRAVTEGEHMLQLSSMAGARGAVGVRSAPHDPADIVYIDFRGRSAFAPVTRLTDVNADILDDKRLGDVEEVWYESTGGTQVQGWIVKPPDFDPEDSYPLILHIHGGPHGMYNVGFSYAYQNYAANGYVVLYTNPRGSTGYGTDFGNAIDNGYPSVDYDDLMAGVDAVIDRGYVDESQMYVTGCSGGGVLSSWVIGHTDRFAGAAVRCPVTNWISFAGTADVVQWAYHRFDGYFWENPDKWLEHSPIMHVGKVTTPTLLMTGELDLRTPMSQTEEYYAALKVLGVETVLLRFYDEFHGTSSKPSNFLRTQLYIMDWFRKHTREEAVSQSDAEEWRDLPVHVGPMAVGGWGDLEVLQANYPAELKDSGEEAVVTARVCLDQGGEVTAVSVNRSGGSTAIDEAAVKTIGSWDFLPGWRYLPGSTTDVEPVPACRNVGVWFAEDQLMKSRMTHADLGGHFVLDGRLVRVWDDGTVVPVTSQRDRVTSVASADLRVLEPASIREFYRASPAEVEARYGIELAFDQNIYVIVTENARRNERGAAIGAGR